MKKEGETFEEYLDRLDIERYWRPWEVLKDLGAGGLPKDLVPRALGICGSAYRLVERHNEATACIQNAIKRGGAYRPSNHQRLATVYFDLRDFSRARYHIRLARDLYVNQASMRGIGETMVDAAFADYYEDAYREAALKAEGALDFPVGDGNQVSALQLLSMSRAAGAPGDALQPAQEATETAAKLHPFVFGKSLWSLGLLSAATRPRHADLLLCRAVSLLSVSHGEIVLCAVDLALLRAQKGTGSVSEAISLATKALSQSPDTREATAVRKAVQNLAFSVRAGRAAKEEKKALWARTKKWMITPPSELKAAALR